MNKKEKNEIILKERQKFVQLINDIVREYRQKSNIVLTYLDRKYYGIDLLADELKYKILLWIRENE